MTCSRLCEIDDHRDALLGRLADQPQHVARLARAERRGRLVEDHDPLAEGDRPRARDGLALAAGHQADLGVRAGELDLQALEQLVGLAGASPGRRPSRARPSHDGRVRSRPGVEVADRGRVVEQREVLVDGLDPQLAGVLGRARSAPPRRRSGSRRRRARPTPERILISVDLPAPLSPSSASTSLSRSSSETSRSAVVAPYCLRRPCDLEDRLAHVSSTSRPPGSCGSAPRAGAGARRARPPPTTITPIDDQLQVDADVEQVQPVGDHAEDEHADDRAADRAAAAPEARAADDHRRDGGQLVELPGARVAGVGAPRGDQPGEARARARR